MSLVMPCHKTPHRHFALNRLNTLMYHWQHIEISLTRVIEEDTFRQYILHTQLMLSYRNIANISMFVTHYTGMGQRCLTHSTVDDIETELLLSTVI